MIRLRLAAAALCFSLMAGTAQSAVLFEFLEVGDDVVGTLSGSLDLTGATPDGDASGIARIFASTASVGTGGSRSTYQISGPTSFGSGGSILGSPTAPGSGDSAFSVAGNFGLVGVPSGYTGGDLSGTLTFLSHTFASLGVTPGSYVWTVTGTTETVTVSFGPSTVIPLPATLPLLIGGLGLAFAAARRRA